MTLPSCMQHSMGRLWSRGVPCWLCMISACAVVLVAAKNMPEVDLWHRVG